MMGSAMSKHTAERGQALVETAIFIPIFLVLLYAILYFGQIGVKQVRVQTAIRYGVNTLPGSTIRIEQMYTAYKAFSAGTSNVPAPGLTPFPCPTSAATQTQLAFNQAQTLPTSAPSAQPYWQMSAPTITCTITFLPVSNVPDMYNTAMGFVNATSNKITGSVSAANYAVNFLPTNYTITGSYNGFLPITLDVMIACTPNGGGGHGTTIGPGMALALAQALGPGTDTKGRGVVPFYASYDSTGIVNGNLCNVG